MTLPDVWFCKFQILLTWWWPASRTVPDRFPVVSLGIFFLGTSDRTMCPEVDSASESEYQGFFLGVKAAGAFG